MDIFDVIDLEEGYMNIFDIIDLQDASALKQYIKLYPKELLEVSSAKETPLMRAAEKGFLEGINILLDSGIKNPYDLRDGIKCPVVWAAINGHINCLPRLLKEFPKLSVSQLTGGLTGLHKIAKSGFHECLELIASSDPTLFERYLASRKQTGVLLTPAHLAACFGHSSMMELLHRLCPGILSLPDAEGAMPSHYALGGTGLIQTLSRLAPETLRKTTHAGDTPAHLYAVLGKIDALDDLSQISHDFFSTKNKHSATPFITAFVQGNIATAIFISWRLGPQEGSPKYLVEYAQASKEKRPIRRQLADKLLKNFHTSWPDEMTEEILMYCSPSVASDFICGKGQIDPLKC